MDSYQGQVLSIWKLFTIAGKQRDLGIFMSTYEVLLFLVPDKKKGCTYCQVRITESHVNQNQLRIKVI